MYLRIAGTVGASAPHPVTGRPSRTFTVRTILIESRVDKEGWGGGLAAEVAGLSAEERDRLTHRAAQKKVAAREKKAAQKEKTKAKKAEQKATSEAKKQVGKKKNR